MTESRVYRINNLSIEQINWVLSQLGDRLDLLEGLRGEPTMHNDLNIETKVKYTDSNGTILHSIGE